jgi:tRNA (guanine37-N1)-methyltransferase
MKIAILTIFPDMLTSALTASILGRARAEGLLTVEAVDIRPFSSVKHKNTDDYPFGGGAGMVMTAQPIVDCVEAVRAKGFGGPCLYLSPRGKPLTQQKVRQLAELDGFLLLCGHYEGVDQRAIDLVVDEEISLGDFVLTGGELAALAVTDAVARLVPGVLGSEKSAEDESFSAGLLEYPQYTRPRTYRGHTVPDVLLNGDHAKIAAWRRKQALLTTLRRRPDLFANALMTDRERVDTLAAACETGGAARAEAVAQGQAPVSACVCAQVPDMADALAAQEAQDAARLSAEVAQAKALENDASRDKG